MVQVATYVQLNLVQSADLLVFKIKFLTGIFFSSFFFNFNTQ